jgi:predicted transposase YbfD/YdcC
VRDKNNEVKAILRLLELLDLTHICVTIDQMETCVACLTFQHSGS